jgi:hypothetical protein
MRSSSDTTWLSTPLPLKIGAMGCTLHASITD